MKVILYISIIGIFSLMSNSSMGQRNANKADRYFDKNLFDEAIKYYELEIKSGDREAVAYSKKQLAECYRIIGEFEQAEKAYRKILKKKKNRLDATNFMNYGKSLKSSAKFEEAKVQFEEYIKLKPDDLIGTVFLQSCDSAQKWLDETMGKVAVNVESINSSTTDFAPQFIDSKTLLFSSSREGSKKALISFNGGMDINYLDFYDVNVGVLSGESVPVRNVSEFNSPKHEGPATFTKDGEEIYFTSTVKGKKDKTTGKQVNTLQVFYSKKDSLGIWIEPVSAFPFNSSEYSVGHPSLSKNADTIYFMSDMEKGFGTTDIYYSVKDREGEWQFPINMGNEVNTFGHELFPYIADNGKLYFSSDSHHGMGQLDIYSSELKYGKWGSVKNLKPPYNSIGNDFGIVFDRSYPRGFFSSDRFNGKGAEDIYSFSDEVPLELTLKEGRIEFLDKKIFDGLKYKLVDNDTGSDSTLASENGLFSMKLEAGKSYTLIAKKSFFPYNKISIKMEYDTLGNYINAVISSSSKPIKLDGFLSHRERIDSVTIETVPLSGVQMELKKSNSLLGNLLTTNNGYFSCVEELEPSIEYLILANNPNDTEKVEEEVIEEETVIEEEVVEEEVIEEETVIEEEIVEEEVIEEETVIEEEVIEEEVIEEETVIEEEIVEEEVIEEETVIEEEIVEEEVIEEETVIEEEVIEEEVIEEEAVIEEEVVEEEVIEEETVIEEEVIEEVVVEEEVVEEKMENTIDVFVHSNSSAGGIMVPSLPKVADQSYTVQIGVYSEKHNIRDLNDLVELSLNNGLIKYFSGEFSSYEKASLHKEELIRKGYKDAFIVTVSKEEGGSSALSNIKLEGLVKANGKVIENASVVIRSQSGVINECKTTEIGTFYYLLLPNQNYTITVNLNGYQTEETSFSTNQMNQFVDVKVEIYLKVE